MDGLASPPVALITDRLRDYRWFGSTAILYVIALFLATFPAFLSFRTCISGDTDQLQHLWILRWNRDCLLQGRLTPIAPGIQYPVGAPTGNFSPLHFQSLLFVGLDPIFGDALAYNLIWLFGMLGTGLGTALLARELLKDQDRLVSTFAGLLAMLSGPMMMHGLGHLELIHMEWFPIFMLVWMRFVDAPGRNRLIVAALTYLLLSMSAAYFAVLSVVPAALYYGWSAARSGRPGLWSWAKSRVPWGVAFAGLVSGPLLFLFSGQIWAASHGFSLNRPRSSFDASGAPVWGYITPTLVHRSRPVNLLGLIGLGDGYLNIENASYLGLIAIGLIVVAAGSRARFRNAGFWWVSTLLLVVLSSGTSWTILGFKIPLPAGWLWDHVSIFRMLRTPARFNLLAGVSASILAAAGLGVLMSRIRSSRGRFAAFLAVSSIAIIDLSIQLPHPPIEPRKPSEAYAFIQWKKPGAAIVDVPQCQSGHPSKANALYTYWQSLHHLPTTAGYSGVSNVTYDQLLYETSPFAFDRLCHSEFLTKSCLMTLDTVVGAEFLDYAWLYLTEHRIDYVVLHKDAERFDDGPVRLAGLRAVLNQARVFEIEDSCVYDRRRIRTPIRPTVLCLDGWKHHGGWGRAVEKVARLAVYNPRPYRELTLVIAASSLRKPRTLRIRSGEIPIAQIRVSPSVGERFESPPFRLPEGLGTITLECDTESVPDQDDPEDRTYPYSLRVATIELKEVASGRPNGLEIQSIDSTEKRRESLRR